MSFLNPALWTALFPLLALPLVIHLLNKQFPKLFRFSSIKNIQKTAAQRSRLYRWRHRLLLLLRTILLLLLLLAFLKPVLDELGAGTRGEGKRSILILLDHSLSMEHKGDGVSSRGRATLEVENLCKTLNPDDEVNIILVENKPRACFVDFSRNHAEARRFVQQLTPGVAEADFNLANRMATRLLSKVKKGAEIYYISDFQRKNWSNINFTGLPPTARLFFVDVAASKKANRAILSAAINQGQLIAGDTVILDVQVGNFSDEPFQDRVSILLDEQTRFEAEVDVPPWSTTTVALPVAVGAPGLHLCEISLPPDALETDNRHYLTLPVLQQEEILVVSDDPEPDKGAVLFLQTALNPFGDEKGSLLPRHVTSAELTAGQLASTRKVFLTRINALNEETCQRLAKFLFQGGGIVYFLDGQADPVNLQRLEAVIGSDSVPLRLTGKQEAENLGTAAQQIIRGQFTSSYLKLFRGSMRQNLGLLEFYDFYHATTTGAGTILLTYADESPAMASFSHGLGTALLMNFSVSEFSSNLARQRIFPAWMQEIVKNLSGEDSLPTSHIIGQSLQAEVWRSELIDRTIKTPSGKDVNLEGQALGERYAISFTPDELGFYTLRDTALRQAFAVNPSPKESDLRQVDKEILPEDLKAEQQGQFVQGQEDFDTINEGRPIFHYFLLACCALLLVEMTLQLAVKKAAAA